MGYVFRIVVFGLCWLWVALSLLVYLGLVIVVLHNFDGAIMLVFLLVIDFSLQLRVV